MNYRSLLFAGWLLLLFGAGCTNEDAPTLNEPETYTFLRDGNSTVSFDGQSTRIAMGEELIKALLDSENSSQQLLEMFRNRDEMGNEVQPFQDPLLNESSKSIKLKTAASRDFFGSNTTESLIITNQLEEWIRSQVSEIFPYFEQLAQPGTAGQIADGTSARFVNEKGLEFDQAVGKSLIGALMTDQMLNHYLSIEVLDEGNNRENNEASVLEEGTNYTTMEHKWDEAYGYLFGASSSPESPLANLGNDDSFLNKYVGRLEGDADFAGTGETIFNAFKRGRAAIVANNYDIRDQQIDIIQENISKAIGVRVVFYLQEAKKVRPADGNFSAYGPSLHDLSEAVGFIYSLRFTRKSGTNESYFSRSEVDGFMDQLLNSTPNGLWDVSDETLDEISNTVADRFDFTVADAAN